MKLRRTTVAVLAPVMAAALALSACGDDSGDDADVADAPTFAAGSTMEKLSKAGKINIGTKFDQTGFGFKGLSETPEGFDVEIGKYIAGKLGISPDNINWVETVSAVREEVLEQGKVDMVVATYTINDKRKQVIDFAGPYYIAGQSILVKADDNSITGPDSFKDGTKKVCSVAGSTPAQNIEKYLKDKATQLVTFDVYSKCADAVKNKQVDALTTDNVILSGFVSNSPNDFKLVGEKFTQEPYGIGLKKGDAALHGFVNDVLTEIYANGDWDKAWAKTAGKFLPQAPAKPTIDRA